MRFNVLTTLVFAGSTTEIFRANLNLRKERRIGTWNVRTRNGPGRVEILAIEADRLGLDVLGLSETRLEGQGERRLENGQLLLHSGGQNKAKGVGILLSKRTAGSLLGYDSINDRIMVVRLEGKPFNLTLVQVYAPTNQASEGDKA